MLMRFSRVPDADQCTPFWSTVKNKKEAVGILSGANVEIAQWTLEQMDAYVNRNTIAESQLKSRASVYAECVK
jgi:hypothetical protein